MLAQFMSQVEPLYSAKPDARASGVLKKAKLGPCHLCSWLGLQMLLLSLLSGSAVHVQVAAASNLNMPPGLPGLEADYAERVRAFDPI